MAECEPTLQGCELENIHKGRQTWAVAFAGFSAFLGLYMTQPLLPTLGSLFRVNKAQVSLTLTACTLGVALAAPLAGSLADRFGRKRIIVLSALMLAGATLMDATAKGLPMLIFWRFVQGLVTPGVFAVTIAYIQEEWAGGGSGRATAVYVTGTVVGGFTGRMIGAFIISHWHWPWVFVVIGTLGFLAALILQALLPVERCSSARAGHSASFKAALQSHLRNRRLLITFVVGFGVLFSLVATYTYVVFYLAAAPFQLGPVALGFLFCTYLAGGAVTPSCGRFIDRYGHRLAMGWSLAFGILGLLLTLVPWIPSVVLGLVLCCTSVFVAQATSSSYIGLAVSHGKAMAVGLYITCYYLGGSAGAWLPGLLWHFLGWPGCVAMVILMQGLTLVIALMGWATGVRGSGIQTAQKPA